MHKVYLVEPKYSYGGKGLVAADSAVQANEIIDNFIRQDNNNALDSWGIITLVSVIALSIFTPMK